MGASAVRSALIGKHIPHSHHSMRMALLSLRLFRVMLCGLLLYYTWHKRKVRHWLGPDPLHNTRLAVAKEMQANRDIIDPPSTPTLSNRHCAFDDPDSIVELQ